MSDAAEIGSRRQQYSAGRLRLARFIVMSVVGGVRDAQAGHERVATGTSLGGRRRLSNGGGRHRDVTRCSPGGLVYGPI